MGSIIKIENEKGEQLFYVQYTNVEKCTDLYKHLTEDQYFQHNKMTISLLSAESKLVSIYRHDSQA
jgi:hypothetical protein